MGYCNKKWVSDYTYRGLIDRVATINGVMETYVAPQVIARYRVLLLDEHGPRWGIPFTEPAEPFGDATTADVLDAQGAVLTQATVYVTEVGDSQARTVLVPEPQAGWHAISLAGWPTLTF
jgi:hypothetical protein